MQLLIVAGSYFAGVFTGLTLVFTGLTLASLVVKKAKAKEAGGAAVESRGFDDGD